MDPLFDGRDIDARLWEKPQPVEPEALKFPLRRFHTSPLSPHPDLDHLRAHIKDVTEDIATRQLEVFLSKPLGGLNGALAGAAAITMVRFSAAGSPVFEKAALPVFIAAAATGFAAGFGITVRLTASRQREIESMVLNLSRLQEGLCEYPDEILTPEERAIKRKIEESQREA